MNIQVSVRKNKMSHKKRFKYRFGHSTRVPNESFIIFFCLCEQSSRRHILNYLTSTMVCRCHTHVTWMEYSFGINMQFFCLLMCYKWHRFFFIRRRQCIRSQLPPTYKNYVLGMSWWPYPIACHRKWDTQCAMKVKQAPFFKETNVLCTRFMKFNVSRVCEIYVCVYTHTYVRIYTRGFLVKHVNYLFKLFFNKLT